MALRLVLPDDFDKRLQQIGDAYVVEDVLPKMKKNARRIVPIDTSRLHDNIDIFSDGKEHGIYANTEYAVYVELGTSKMRSQAFLRPALTGPLPKAKKKVYK